MKASLHLTHNCNLRCGYCYTGQKTATSMPLAVGEKAINFVMDRSSLWSEFTFFGGEPLLEPELMRRLTDYAQRQSERRGLAVRLNLITNGTLLNRETLTFIKDHQIALKLSVDGTRNSQDCSRTYRDGTSSYADVEKAMPEILAYCPETLLLMVITPRSQRYLAQSIRELFGMGFRYFVPSPNFEDTWGDEELAALARQYEQVADFYVGCLARGEDINISFMDGKIHMHIVSENICAHQCEIARGEIAIAGSGNIYPCLRLVGEDNTPETCLGSIFTGIDEEKKKKFMLGTRELMRGCEGCALVKRCLNNCGALNYVLSGSVREASGLVCRHEQMLIPIVDRAANVLYRDSNPRFLEKFYFRDHPPCPGVS